MGERTPNFKVPLLAGLELLVVHPNPEACGFQMVTEGLNSVAVGAGVVDEDNRFFLAHGATRKFARRTTYVRLHSYVGYYLVRLSSPKARQRWILSDCSAVGDLGGSGGIRCGNVAERRRILRRDRSAGSGRFMDGSDPGRKLVQISLRISWGAAHRMADAWTALAERALQDCLGVGCVRGRLAD